MLLLLFCIRTNSVMAPGYWVQSVNKVVIEFNYYYCDDNGDN
jgi:hypothetical protein